LDITWYSAVSYSCTYLYRVLDASLLPYLTLPLPPSAEASSGPSAHNKFVASLINQFAFVFIYNDESTVDQQEMRMLSWVSYPIECEWVE